MVIGLGAPARHHTGVPEFTGSKTTFTVWLICSKVFQGKKLQVFDAYRKEVVKQVSLVVEGYIELAAVPVSDKANQMPLPAAWKRAHRDLHLVPVVSKEVAVDPSCQYDGIAHLTSFGDTMTFVGGINKPKLVTPRPSSLTHT